jgi:uncharacterized protein YdhG (YjbR/CyaY superfamily)
MQKQKKTATTITEYIKLSPPAVQTLLKQMRSTIQSAAPQAEEYISYKMPAYKYKGKPLVYFAAYTHHIGFYATPTGHKKFEKEFSNYKTGKGSVQFPITHPLPLSLIKKVVKFRVSEIEKKHSLPALDKTEKINEVEKWLQQFSDDFKKQVEQLRKIIKSSSPKLNERIKWNAPSYFFKEDIVTVGPVKNEKLLLIFHHPLIEKIKSPLLEGNYKNRRLVTFNSPTDIKKKKEEIIRIIKQHIKILDK